jgi:hypothetical protein
MMIADVAFSRADQRHLFGFHFPDPLTGFSASPSPSEVDREAADRTLTHTSPDTTLPHPSSMSLVNTNFAKTPRKPKNSNASTQFPARNRQKNLANIELSRDARECAAPACWQRFDSTG